MKYYKLLLLFLIIPLKANSIEIYLNDKIYNIINEALFTELNLDNNFIHLNSIIPLLKNNTKLSFTLKEGEFTVQEDSINHILKNALLYYNKEHKINLKLDLTRLNSIQKIFIYGEEYSNKTLSVALDQNYPTLKTQIDLWALFHNFKINYNTPPFDISIKNNIIKESEKDKIIAYTFTSLFFPKNQIVPQMISPSYPIYPQKTLHLNKTLFLTLLMSNIEGNIPSENDFKNCQNLYMDLIKNGTIQGGLLQGSFNNKFILSNQLELQGFKKVAFSELTLRNKPLLSAKTAIYINFSDPRGQNLREFLNYKLIQERINDRENLLIQKESKNLNKVDKLFKIDQKSFPFNKEIKDILTSTPNIKIVN